MDGVELARQTAAELHARAVEAGHDPWDPYAFAVAEARRRGLDVEPAVPGAQMLDGARATFMPAERLILHENAGTAFEQAFLVAHEIGHAELGDDPGDEPIQHIDPARPAETAPVGFDRVLDYGRRQRREVQMDLFAREFLLPRSVARTLHVNNGLTATQIAEKLGAPFDVVAQQLLDALLLPPATAPSDPERVDRPLNELQATAAQHRGEAYLLEAGPGTGKTQTLTARVLGLLDESMDPRRILLLTFSNRAAGEMAERIARKRPDAAAAMWIGTFHAFGLDIVRRFHADLGLPKDPALLDRADAVGLLENEFPRLGLEHYRNLHDPTQIIADILTAVSRAKDEVVDADEYARLVQAMEPGEAAEKAAEVARVYAAYERLKRGSHRIDFGDLISLPVRLLEANTAVRAHFQGLYDHVLVDEYQDVNRSSVRLLAALKPDGRNLWVVGDAKQSIYRFRGASSFNVSRFGREDFPGGKRGRLVRNYRSAAEVVEAFSAFGGASARLESDRGPNGLKPELRTVQRAEQQAVALADTIEEMRRAGHGYRSQAVLCTGNERLSSLAKELECLGVPVLFLGSLLERPEVKDLLALLSLLVDRRAMGLLRVGCWPDFAMALPDVASVVGHLRDTDQIPGAWLAEPACLPGVSEQGRRSLQAIAAALAGFDQESSSWTILATLLLDRTRMAARLGASSDLADRNQGIALWQFLNFVRVQPRADGLPIARLLERVRRLVRLGDDRDLRQLPNAAQGLDAVRLMTIHGAKGLEFPVVHMPGVNAGTIPRTAPSPRCPPPDGMIAGATGSVSDAFRAAEQAEQECLFYVALSRARDRLFLYAPTEKRGGSSWPISTFVGRLGATLARRSAVPSRSLPAAPEDGAVALAIEGPLRFGAPQIALYESCPRRFFYTHVLQVGGRRTATAFMQMHEAVQSVMDGLLASRERVTDEVLEERLHAALDAHGLDGHGYRADFAALALTMIRYLVASREGSATEAPAALRLTLDGDEIVVRPDEVLVRADGTRSLRRIRTGHRRSTEGKDVGAAAFLLAVRQAFPDAVVEMVHLSDGASVPVALSPRELETRREKLIGFLRDIRAGRFPASASAFTCPGCPAFFVCGPTPAGTLRKNFA